MLCYWTAATIAILYVLFDVNYFIRIILTIAWGRLFQKRKKILEQTAIYGKNLPVIRNGTCAQVLTEHFTLNQSPRVCFTQDIDLVFKHMNNARYLRELDFARFHYYDRSGLFSAISAKGGGMVQGACSSRYRKPLPIFTPYKITTQLVYWDDKNFYLEHEIVSLTDNFIRAVVLSKQSVINLKVPVSEIVSKVDPTAKKPELSKELQLWLDSMAESSEKLKKKR